jgi:hypothetical protein
MAIIQDTKQRGEASHWYKPTGEPCHFIAKAKGDGDRATTITDARKLNLLPSVTNILSVIGKPGLDKWRLNQVALAAYNSPPQGEESADYYTKRIIEAAFEQVSAAADLGSRIHDALEKILEGEPVEEEMLAYVQPTIDWKQDRRITFDQREIVLVNTAEGYAGRCDVIGRGAKGQPVILDYKTRKSEPGKPMTAYDGQGAQLAAYAVAHWGEEKLHKVTAANVFISTTEPGRMEVHKHDNLVAEWEFFRACCAIWRKIKNYDPRRGAA